MKSHRFNLIALAACACALAAGVLAITQRAPIWAAIFVWELARPPWWLMVVFIASATATHGLQKLAERRTTDTEASVHS